MIRRLCNNTLSQKQFQFSRNRNPLLCRNYANQIISKLNLKQLIEQKKTKNSDFYIIDVREPQEVSTTGLIETSVNIPLGQLTSALSMSADEFKKTFGEIKPSNKQSLIFSCKMGGRAETACEIAKASGFTTVQNYKGSAMEWWSDK